MSITVQLDLPEDMAKKARATGLLEPARVARLLAEELRRCHDRQELRKMLDPVCSQPGEAMTLHEIQAEVHAVRTDRRRQREIRR